MGVQVTEAPNTRHRAAPSLLVLRALNLGDLLVAVPALRALRRSFPGHRLTLATAGALAPLARAAGVDAVLPASAPEDLRALSREDRCPAGGEDDGPGVVPPRPDVAVNLHGAGPRSHHALDATRPRRRLGVRHPEAPAWTGPSWAEVCAAHAHERHRWCAVLEWHGVPADPDELRLPSAVPPDGRIVVHPGAAFGAKRWPAERFAEVARALDGHGPVVVTGSPAEVPLARRVAKGARLPAERVLAGTTGVAELADLVAGAALVVCGDTGIAHLASAFGTPSVVLFGPVGPEQWGPPPGPHRTLTRAELRRGERFADTPDPALLAVSVDEVLAACRELLGRLPPRGLRNPTHAPATR